MLRSLVGSEMCIRDSLTGCDVLAGWDSFEADVINKHLIQSISNYQPTLLSLIHI